MEGIALCSSLLDTQPKLTARVNFLQRENSPEHALGPCPKARGPRLPGRPHVGGPGPRYRAWGPQQQEEQGSAPHPLPPQGRVHSET